MEFLLALFMSLFGNVSTTGPVANPISSPEIQAKAPLERATASRTDIIIVFEDTHFRPTIER